MNSLLPSTDLLTYQDLVMMTSNRPRLASFLNRRSNQGRWTGYSDAQVQTVFSEHEDSEMHLSFSGLIPGTLNTDNHHKVLDILQRRAPYFFPQAKEPVQDSPTIPGTKYPMPPQWDPPPPADNVLGPDGQGWPPNFMPVEIFEQIASSLSRDDMLNMRLVDHEFEAKISSRIFQTVVVPFKPDIYGVIENNKGKSVATADSARPHDHELTITRASLGRPLSDGMEVFRSWGKRIKKFALTFELDEETFFKLPAKDYFEKQVSFWGHYRWPRSEYTRFKSCEQLEKKADETRCMTLALSQLTSLNELGLAIDSGLGWIEGPDCSDRVHLFREKQRIFGTTYSEMTRSQRNKQWIWDAVSLEVKRNRGLAQERFEVGTPAIERGAPNQYEATTFQTIHGPYHESHATPNLQWAQVPIQDVYPPLIFRGLDIERGVKDTDNVLCKSSYPSDALTPNELKYSHIEWLMENEWAQQAFLTSLTISVTDNASNFRHIQTLNIAKVSSRYLSALSNKAFWAALPNLQTLKMFVSPDWRDIVRGSDELLQAAMICPSSAGAQFFDFLESCVAKSENITSLDIGWLGGGERATGLFARNQHILPAPVLSITDPDGAYLSCKVLKLPFVKHLTLTNCWFHPSALKVFVRRMEQASLQTLKLNSVSLTATAGNNAANPVATAQVGHHNIQAPAVLPVAPINFNFPANYNFQVANAGYLAPNNINTQVQNAGFIAPQLLAPAVGPFQLQSPPANANASQSQDTLSSLNTFHPYMQHPGRSTVNASVPPGGHLSHWATEQSGPDNECLELSLRNGSWGEVIDKISPGKTIDQQRALLNHSVINPKMPKPTSLKSIEFISCGYVRLTHHPALVQSSIPEVMSRPPRCLRHRHKVLSKIMMRADHDVLLGTIAPAMPQPESDVLQVAFNMRMGWKEDDMTQYEAREDGQPIGGSGRFSGVVARGSEPIDES